MATGFNLVFGQIYLVAYDNLEMKYIDTDVSIVFELLWE